MGNGRLQLASAHRHRVHLETLPATDDGYDQLRAFFESCWNVKDHAISDLPKSQHQAFEKAVDGELSLRVVADVANRSKHVVLTRKDRVGGAITFKAIQVVDGSNSTKAATAEYSISLNDGTTHSAVSIADESLRSWETVLQSFNL